MSILNLQSSIDRARARLGDAAAGVRRRTRADQGTLRMAPAVRERLVALTSGMERPSMRALLDDLRRFCADEHLRCPSRSALYLALARLDGPRYLIADLPEHARETLHNLDPAGAVSGAELAFACLNYGSTAELSYAAGLPWLCLHRAARMPGWRPKSRGLLAAIAAVRGP